MQETSVLRTALTSALSGEVDASPQTRTTYSRDMSLFAVEPAVVIFPKDAADVARAVRTVRELKQRGHDVSITPRAAGTDMTGGPLTSSVSMVLTRHMNHIFDVTPRSASAEPGVYYRDFEKATLGKGGLLPCYPASRKLCALGGMVGNDAAGELTLGYGKTHEYVEELDVVLSDGSQITVKELSEAELAAKKELGTLEGSIYRELHGLLETNFDAIEAAKPDVSKNSAGFALWRLWNKTKKTFNLAQLFIGSQGTLGIITRARFRLVKPKNNRAMVVIFLSDISLLPRIVDTVMRFGPQSFESYDDKTLRIAVRFFPQIVKQLGIANLFKLGFAFLHEVRMVTTGGVPKLILLAEFAGESDAAADEKAGGALEALTQFPVAARVVPRGIQTEKYWAIRRQAFALLRTHVHGLYAASFIEDIVVPPESYPVFLPKLWALLDSYHFLYTIQGHIGNGNLHIFPLLDIRKPEAEKLILELMPRVFRLVVAHGGSITGEHNDGLIRTPYLPLMYGEKMVALFEQTKNIFDPLNILNPGKKVGGTEADIHAHLIHSL